MEFADVVAKIENVTGRTIQGGSSRCPAHSDRDPSLSVTEGTDGKTLVHCHAGCSVQEICQAIGIQPKDLFAKPSIERVGSSGSPTIAATFDYTDIDGTLTFQVVKLAPKGFRQRRPDPEKPGDWIWNTKGVAKTLYNLPAVAAAVEAQREGLNDPEDPRSNIWIVEGEKDADALTRTGAVATTNPGGAGSWLGAHSKTLASSVCSVVQDNDPAGHKHAADVYRSLKAAGCRVDWFRPADGFKDVAQHLGADKTVDDLVKVTPSDEPSAGSVSLHDLGMGLGMGLEGHEEGGEEEEETNRHTDGTISLKELYELPPPEPLISKWLNKDSFVQLFAPPGTGKTFVALSMALHIAAGVDWHGHEVTQSKVLYALGEGVSGAGKRAQAWEEHHKTEAAQPNFRFLRHTPLLGDPKDIVDFVDAYDGDPPDIVFIDTLARASVGLEENSATDMGQAVKSCDAIRRQLGCTVVVVHHTGKSEGLGARGSNAIRGAVDTEIELTGDLEKLTVKMVKQRDDDPAGDLFLTALPVGNSVVLVEAELGRPDHQSMTLEIAEVISMYPGSTVTQIRGQVTGNNGIIGIKVKDMIRGGLVDVDSDGRTHKHTLTEAGERYLANPISNSDWATRPFVPTRPDVEGRVVENPRFPDSSLRPPLRGDEGRDGFQDQDQEGQKPEETTPTRPDPRDESTSEPQRPRRSTPTRTDTRPGRPCKSCPDGFATDISGRCNACLNSRKTKATHE